MGLNIQVFLAAKSAPMWMRHMDLLQRNTKDGGNLLLVSKRVLSATGYGDPLLLITPGDARFGLQKSMFLPPRNVGQAHDVVGRFQRGIYIAKTQIDLMAQIAVWPDLRRIGGECLPRIQQGGQVFIFDVDQLAGMTRLLLALGHYKSYGITTKAHPVMTQDRLIGRDQAKTVEARNIGMGKNPHDPRGLPCRIRID